jgi:hypothetical protein
LQLATSAVFACAFFCIILDRCFLLILLGRDGSGIQTGPPVLLVGYPVLEQYLHD